MKMKKWKTLALIGVMVVMNATNAFAFGSKPDEAARGTWSDKDNLTWTYWGSYGGESFVIGAGPRFCDVYPEITDPEYFLKENICYPGEPLGTLNSQGIAKADYTEGCLPLLQEFVNSFDWIHSDEITRLKTVHERIARGRNGNGDQFSEGEFSASFNVLQNKKGNCGNYSWEFQKLCSYVGLECVSYSSSYMHTSNMVRINGQWITVDPYVLEDLFDNRMSVPVDFEAEKNRYSNEYKNSETYKQVMDGAELQRKAESGEITWKEYFKTIYPDKSIQEIEDMLGMDLDSYAKLWQE